MLSWVFLHRQSELFSFKFTLSVTYFQVQLESSIPSSSLHCYQRFLHPFIHKRGRNTCNCWFYSPHHLEVSPPQGLSKEIAVLPLLSSSLAHRVLAASSRVHLSMQEEPGRASSPGAQTQWESRAGVTWRLPYSQLHLFLWAIPFPY